MKKNMRNALAISGLAIAMGTSTFMLEASANDGTSRIQRSHQERILKTKKLNTEKISRNRRHIVGVVTAIEGNSITITKGSKTFTVTVAADTRLLNRSWQPITIDKIAVGNKLKVTGTITDATIAAKTIRDISLQ